MDLKVVYDTLNFHINKVMGEYYPPSQLDLIVDVAQMSVFNDYFLKYLSSQRIDDALAPFYRKFTFTYASTANGLVSAPGDYFHATALRAQVQDSGGNTKTRDIVKLNPNELAGRLNSQIFPPTLIDPVYLTVEDWNVQLYPEVPQAGYMMYIARPKAPVFVYTTTGRKINYDANASTQLEWSDKDILSIIYKALKAMGINTREQDLMQWSQAQDNQNIETPNKA